eukprot:scaffold158144_cov35-Attheya_sp.AAC.1
MVAGADARVGAIRCGGDDDEALTPLDTAAAAAFSGRTPPGVDDTDAYVFRSAPLSSMVGTAVVSVVVGLGVGTTGVMEATSRSEEGTLVGLVVVVVAVGFGIVVVERLGLGL